MGAEAACTVTVGKKSAAGKALLETTELVFRPPKGSSDLRLKIPFSEISGLAVEGDELRVRWPLGTARFALGHKTASTWLAKIQNPKGLLEKLGIKPEHKVFATGRLPEEFCRAAGEIARSFSTLRPGKDTDLVFLAVDVAEDLSRIAKYVPYIKRDGAIWTVTPKGTGGIKESDVMAAGKTAGLVDVKVVSFSDTHSANKFVIPKALR